MLTGESSGTWMRVMCRCSSSEDARQLGSSNACARAPASSASSAAWAAASSRGAANPAVARPIVCGPRAAASFIIRPASASRSNALASGRRNPSTASVWRRLASEVVRTAPARGRSRASRSRQRTLSGSFSRLSGPADSGKATSSASTSPRRERTISGPPAGGSSDRLRRRAELALRSGACLTIGGETRIIARLINRATFACLQGKLPAHPTPLARMTEPPKLEDLDPVETQEWLESIDSVLKTHGPQRAHFLLERLIDYTRRSGAYLPFKANTAYVNSIPTGREPQYPGNRAVERRIEAYIRWNAMARVVQANRISSEYGGHLSSYASSATLYEVGFNHFWRAPSAEHPGDLVFVQGHSSPGIYARAYLEGRLSESQLHHFRQEAGGPGQGLSSYPHPWLMPDFWQFPTVSMGLGPMMAIFQARFTRYLENRGLVKPSDQKVWAFLGDGEMDEPESMGALTMPVREGLDNLIFVINANLQRLDGPVRGNGKIIQELESAFLGAGWNVIKVLWGSRWDPLLARDHLGLLRKAMEETVDGEYQNFKAKGGAYTREHFFGKFPELKAMVANMSDEEIWRLNRGGHDPLKVYAAYAAAMSHKGQPTVILAKTVKGYGLGKGGEGQMVAHQQKKLSEEDLRAFRDRFNIPVSDEELAHLPFRQFEEGSEEARYLHARRSALGGYLPIRRHSAAPLTVPPLQAFSSVLEGTGEREISTTMAFVRILTVLLKDKNIGRNIVPIVPDEARTFGMEGLFRQIGIYSSVGQLYTPQDAETLMSYREDKKGQMLEEGINEAGSLCSWMAAGTAYSNHGINMVPFFIFYSMFGFQRVGDFIWASGDIQARGFLLGATAGRTTLAGEGLQHQDGHSQLVATTVPNCVAYDPAFAYELAVII